MRSARQRPSPRHPAARPGRPAVVSPSRRRSARALCQSVGRIPPTTTGTAARVRRATMADGPQCAACVCQIVLNYVFGNFNRINPIRSLILDPCCVPCASFPAASRRRPRMPQSVCHSNGHRIVSPPTFHDTTSRLRRHETRSFTVSRIVTLPPCSSPSPALDAFVSAPTFVPVSGACGVHCPCPTIEIHSRPFPLLSTTIFFQAYDHSTVAHHLRPQHQALRSRHLVTPSTTHLCEAHSSARPSCSGPRENLVTLGAA